MAGNKTIIRNARIINEGQITEGDLLIEGDRIAAIGQVGDQPNAKEIEAAGQYLCPGIIDDQVHFREPGLTHKADIGSESHAAVAGGVTSFMEMPNTKPAALTQELLEEKFAVAAKTSPANFSFFMGAGNDNLEEVLKTDNERVCGVKIFMGSSTGNMLVDNTQTLEALFSKVSTLISTHCEDEARIRERTAQYRERFGEAVPFSAHPEIRDEQACLLSSTRAVDLARKHGTRLNILHISTADEIALFDNSLPLREKRITSEVCVHHLWFDASDYETLGSKIKCNPAIKDARHKPQLLQALLDDRFDIVATDHAPHTAEEKAGNYFSAPSGLPLIQHSFQLMASFAAQGKISLERVVEKMCHAPAECFRLRERGYIREGYKADLFLYDPNAAQTVAAENIHYRCGWSPLEGHTFGGSVSTTFVNGQMAWESGKFHAVRGERLLFERDR